MPDNIKIWMVIDHPMQISTALGILQIVKKKYQIVNLIVSKHPYWEEYNPSQILKYFNQVVFFERPSPRLRFTILTGFLWPLTKTWFKIKNLNIKKEDIIICFSDCVYIENLLISLHPKNKKILFEPKYVYDNTRRWQNDKSARDDFRTFLYNISEFLFGIHKTGFTKIGGEFYKEKLSKIYDKFFIFKNITTKSFSENELPYSNIFFGKKNKKPLKIYLFGSNKYLTECPNNLAIANKILNYLRKNFSGYQLIYKAAPNEIIDEKLMDLKGFTIERNQPTEIVLLNEIDDIYMVFSFYSVSSVSSLNFGINSYCFINLFDLPEKQKQGYFGKGSTEGVFSDIPAEFFINDLNCKPKVYLDDNFINNLKNKAETAYSNIF